MPIFGLESNGEARAGDILMPQSDSISSFEQLLVNVNQAFGKTAKEGSDIRFGADSQVK